MCVGSRHPPTCCCPMGVVFVGCVCCATSGSDVIGSSTTCTGSTRRVLVLGNLRWRTWWRWCRLRSSRCDTVQRSSAVPRGASRRMDKDDDHDEALDALTIPWRDDPTYIVPRSTNNRTSPAASEWRREIFPWLAPCRKVLHPSTAWSPNRNRASPRTARHPTGAANVARRSSPHVLRGTRYAPVALALVVPEGHGQTISSFDGWSVTSPAARRSRPGSVSSARSTR